MELLFNAGSMAITAWSLLALDGSRVHAPRTVCTRLYNDNVALTKRNLDARTRGALI